MEPALSEHYVLVNYLRQFGARTLTRIKQENK